MQKPKILLVDDDAQALDSTRRILELSGFEVTTASAGDQALDLLRPRADSVATRFDLVLTDVRMPGMTGLELFQAMQLLAEPVPVILMTAYGQVEDAVWAMKLGAIDFLSKPFKRQTLLQAVGVALERGRIRRRGKTQIEPKPASASLLQGNSERIARLRELIRQVARSPAPVLIHGESGTGKELVARALHAESARNGKPFIAVNCAAIPEHLMESELFGHEKGAFTGATQTKAGLFEAASSGTLFLDEIGDLPLGLQVKLLRVLQEGEVRRVGATLSRKVDVRLISATHRDLKARVAEGTFREDLLFRLDVIGLEVPALRERGQDVLILAEEFMREAAARLQKGELNLSEEVRQLFLRYRWPGNVRELSNAIERAAVFCDGTTIEIRDLPPVLLEGSASDAVHMRAIPVLLGTPLREVEDLLIRRTLEATEGDKEMAAKLLGVNSRTIYRKLERKPEE
jgi:two-component system response regulator HydG